jgi:uncharacterized membrane protein required for colicin V production
LPSPFCSRKTARRISLPTLDIPSLRIAAAFGGLFLATLLIGGLINILASYLVDYTGLTGTDRVLGMAFGLARGAAVITLLVLAAGLTPLPRDPWWQQALLLHHFQEGAVWLQSLLPAGTGPEHSLSLNWFAEGSVYVRNYWHCRARSGQSKACSTA